MTWSTRYLIENAASTSPTSTPAKIAGMRAIRPAIVAAVGRDASASPPNSAVTNELMPGKTRVATTADANAPASS